MRLAASSLASAFVLTLSACVDPLTDAAPQAAGAYATVAGTIGNASRMSSRTITPLEIVEDSRCPANVRCIQAGTVRLRVRLQERRKSRELVIGLEQPARLQTGWLYLAAVCPVRVVSDALTPHDYRFTFAISASAVAPNVNAPCG